jgi:hypothetical protein
MVVQMLFCQGDILDGLGVRAAFEFDEAINPEPAHGMSDSKVLCDQPESLQKVEPQNTATEPARWL